jgi:uncharacterized membrane protein (Fun14 family)
MQSILQVTYVLSICVISMSREHLVLSAPWLAGSGLTILLDFFVSDILPSGRSFLVTFVSDC